MCFHLDDSLNDPTGVFFFILLYKIILVSKQ